MATVSSSSASVTVLYLGNFSRWDTALTIKTGNYVAENAAFVMNGQVITQGSMALRTFTRVDSVPDTILSINDHPTYGDREGVKVNGAGPTIPVDAAIRVNVTIQYVVSGITQTATISTFLVQLENGDVYCWPSSEYGGPNVLDNRGEITKFTVNSVVNNNGSGDGLFYSHGTIANTVVCFAAGTMIETGAGPKAVEDLAPGDLVRTLDHGLQPIRWIGQRRIAAADIAAAPERLAPIRVRAGALGAGLPRSDLTLSPQHRLLVRSRVVERMAQAPEALVAVKHLLGHPGVEQRVTGEDVCYYHILLDHHEVLLANGAPAESLLLGPEARQILGERIWSEIGHRLPHLVLQNPRPARRLLNGRLGRKLLERVTKNATPFLEPRPAAETTKTAMALPDRRAKRCTGPKTLSMIAG